MSALDDFLDLCDADPDFDSDDNDDPFERLTNSENKIGKKNEEEEKSNKNVFSQLFGSPVQVNLKGQSTNTANNTNSTRRESDGLSQKLGTVQKGTGYRLKSGFTPKPDDSLTIIDPYTRLRLFKNSVTLYSDEVQTLELSLKERNLTIPYTPFSKVISIKDKGQFWTSGVLVRKLPGVRQSAKGNEYALWEINDLDSVDSTTLFLFGTSASSETLNLIPVGSLVDIVNPSIMRETQSGVAKLKLSVSLSSQLRQIGTARDFGYCGSKRKDGKDCPNPVNKFKCDVCIHHASAELRKLGNGKSKKNAKWEKKGFTEFEKAQFAARMQSKVNVSADGLITANSQASKKNPVASKQKPSVRMELQDPTNTMRRKSGLGNHSSISFSKDSSELLSSLSTPENLTKTRKELDLDPRKTKHLSERDRVLLERLDKSKSKSDLPAMLVGPNAGSKNFLKYLSDVENKERGDQVDSSGSSTLGPGPVIMTRETLFNMQKALNFVKNVKPIQKKDPNAIPKKRKLDRVEAGEAENKSQLSSRSESMGGGARSDSTHIKRNGLELDTTSEEFQKILNAKSAHSAIAEETQQDEYFNKLERKEAIENKLLSTFSVATTAFMCRECKYVALSKSDLCKDNNHLVRVVKAMKRFFKCKDCGNRTMSLDRLPRRPCANCKSSCWLPAPVGKERAGPTLDSERLAIRGDEEKFLGSTGAKLFL